MERRGGGIEEREGLRGGGGIEREKLGEEKLGEEEDWKPPAQAMM
jgi:hypothetical protein